MSLTKTRVSVVHPHNRTESTASTLSNTQDLYGLIQDGHSPAEQSHPPAVMRAGVSAATTPASMPRGAAYAHESDKLRIMEASSLGSDRNNVGEANQVSPMSSAASTLRGPLNPRKSNVMQQKLIVDRSKIDERRAQALASAAAAQDTRLLEATRSTNVNHASLEPRTQLPDRPLPPLPSVTIPLEPVTSKSGRQIRNYELHQGSNHFLFKGRISSSRDNPTLFAASLSLAFVVPILFFVFSGPFLWQYLGAGGKASIFVFVYTCAIMWTSMVGPGAPFRLDLPR